MKIFRKFFFNILVPAPMEVKGDLLSNSTFFKDQWENYKVTTGLREKSKNVRFASLYPSATTTVKFKLDTYKSSL